MDGILKSNPWIEIEKTKTTVVSDMLTEHIHPHAELYFLLSGERRYFVGSEIYDVAPGNLVIIPPNAIHKTVSLRQKGYDRFVLYFSEECITALQTMLGREAIEGFLLLGCVSFSSTDAHAVRALFEKAFAEQAKNDAFGHASLYSLLMQILVFTLRSGKKKTFAASEGADRISLVCAHINENFQEPFTLKDAARMACMEKTYFSKRFKALTGFNFSQYLSQVRLHAAQRLLLTTPLTVSEIASLSGFSGSNYFKDAFSKAFGVCPSEYRRREGPPASSSNG